MGLKLETLSPELRQRILRDNPDAFGPRRPRLRADDQKPTQGHSLVCFTPRKDKSGTGPVKRTRIRFTIYSVRPGDWDGYSVKELQDMLVRSKIIPDDNWRILQGEVTSEKAHSKSEERTEITITPI